jgi:hypothetical protein
MEVYQAIDCCMVRQTIIWAVNDWQAFIELRIKPVKLSSIVLVGSWIIFSKIETDPVIKSALEKSQEL